METSAKEVKFAADRMLGKLAKWLRVMGQDVIYGQHLSGYGLIRAARAENRLILTRDHGLKKKQPPDFLFIESDHYREQLRQVIRARGLRPLDNAFTRCLECNLILERRPKASVEKIVPPYVFTTQESFSSCPQCHRV
ncbi:MAG TPA: Mut7-C RNAse domain-containing protein, partial [Candidatus Binatia bacterium]|nr:Mut7-C RNAse domain-containing protein [Candidatus Binatia bacterium]